MPQTCICCGCGDRSAFLGDLHRCGACGHVWAEIDLSEDALHGLYSAEYFEGEEYLDYAREGPSLRRNFRPRVRDLARRHPKGARLWEIGAAMGYFLDEASSHFDARGCDISEYAAGRAKKDLGADVTCGDFLEMDAGGPYDVVCLWDTVEHLAAPHRYLEKAAGLLASGGTLALSTGDIGSFVARFRGRKWRLIHPPTHMHYFSESSMTALLGRLGFSELYFRRHASWRSADAVAYRLLECRGGRISSALYAALRATGLLNLHFPLNTFDLMTVYGRKT